MPLWLPYRQAQTAPAPSRVAATSGCRIRAGRRTRAHRRRLVVVGRRVTATITRRLHAAVAAQLDVMPHVMLGGLVHEQALQLSDRLADLLPGDLEHVFLSESGSVAVEIGLKIALQYWLNQGVKHRTRFVCFRHAYHGDTFAAMSVCDPVEGMHHLFGDIVSGQQLSRLAARCDGARGVRARRSRRRRTSSPGSSWSRSCRPQAA